jgi:gamma-glutamyltranspeptidase/glutathione hydrolase
LSVTADQPKLIERPRPLVRATRGVAACGHPLAVNAALEVFARDGNAVDAAIAAAASLCVLLPESCGLGGDALFMIREPDGEIRAWNGSGAAPAALSGPIPADGAGTAAVPGAVRAWEVAHRTLGKIPWAGLFASAINLAEAGMAYSEALTTAIGRHRARLELGAGGWDLMAAGLRPGSLVRQPALAMLLRRVATEGSSAFYCGEIAQAIEAAVAIAGGSLSATDLANHETVEGAPLMGSYRGVRIAAQPPVSQAGLALMALAALERTGVEGLEARTHVLIEAIGAAFDRVESFGEAERVRQMLLSTLSIDICNAARRRGPRLPSHTTAVATADREGRVVSMLISVFDEFGGAALVAEAGILLNDRMAGFSADESSPNYAAPGRRPVHTLSPFIVDDGVRQYALATPGADGQVQVVVQLIAAIVDLRKDLNEALHLPRWRSADGELHLEGGFPSELATALERRGHRLVPTPAAAGMFGAAVIAGFDQTCGTLFAASDPRREAWAGGC